MSGILPQMTLTLFLLGLSLQLFSTRTSIVEAFQPRRHDDRRRVVPPSRPIVSASTMDYADILMDQEQKHQQPSIAWKSPSAASGVQGELEALAKLDAASVGLIRSPSADFQNPATRYPSSNTNVASSLSSAPLLSSIDKQKQQQQQQQTRSRKTKAAASLSTKAEPTIFKSNTSNSNNFRSLSTLSNINNNNTSLEGGDLVCRVVARSDAKLPAPSATSASRVIRRQLDDIYHAHAHQQTRNLNYLMRPTTTTTTEGEQQTNDATNTASSTGNSASTGTTSIQQEQDLVATVRTSLEDAGFELLSRRDLDLCEALNAGYLLRLSILPDVSKLDPGIAQEFYPEHFDSTTGKVVDQVALAEKLLFDGRVLVFWRGYSQEVTRGRLLLPKVDYLQASLVQRLFGLLKKRLDVWERALSIRALAMYRQATACFLHYMRRIVDQIPNQRVSKRLRRQIRSPYSYSAYKALNNGKLPTIKELRAAAASSGKMFKLGRYGGSQVKFVGSPNPMDALNPFIICEGNDGFTCSASDTNCNRQRALKVDRDMYESLNSNKLRCPYDAKKPRDEPVPPMQLLERVSIATLVDVFTKEGRRNLIRTIFSKSELVEPTYEEVVVVWRPLSEEQQAKKKIRIKPPKVLYELADMFDVNGLPEIPKEEPEPAPMPLEIRTFEGVPMANLPAVLPKTKLVFRPADAVVLDSASILTLLIAASSMRFDNPRLDLIALVSLVLWIFRTVFRYSNKLARYDLLVKKFLTSKLSHRNSGALKYLATQAGSQRATRAALVHNWLANKLSPSEEPLQRANLISKGKREINDLIDGLKDTPVDIDAALNDLEDLALVTRSDIDSQQLKVVRDKRTVDRTLRQTWGSLFDGKLKGLIGRRERSIDETTAAP